MWISLQKAMIRGFCQHEHFISTQDRYRERDHSYLNLEVKEPFTLKEVFHFCRLLPGCGREKEVPSPHRVTTSEGQEENGCESQQKCRK